MKDKVEVERQVRRFRGENPDVIVTTLRTAATLGPHIRNFATRFFARPVAPQLMGYDPLMQFVHERGNRLIAKHWRLGRQVDQVAAV